MTGFHLGGEHLRIAAITGWGSPDAQVLVPLLARYAVS
jgi:hypothetical protein